MIASITEFTYQGRLEYAEKAVTGTMQLKFELYDAAGELKGEDQKEVTPTKGIVSVLIDPAGGNPAIFADELWLKVIVIDGMPEGEDVALPLQKVTSVPKSTYARFGGGYPGQVIAWAGKLTNEEGSSNLPKGWLVCDGRPVSSSRYSLLFAAIGTSWGDGKEEPVDNPDTYFNLPDLRGRFLRGVDKMADGTTPADDIRDSDANDRTALGDNVVNEVGSVQEDAFQGHWHYDYFEGSNAGGVGSTTWYHYGRGEGEGDAIYPRDDHVFNPKADNLGNGDPRTSSETRPKNAYVYWIIYTGVIE